MRSALPVRPVRTSLVLVTAVFLAACGHSARTTPAKPAAVPGTPAVAAVPGKVDPDAKYEEGVAANNEWDYAKAAPALEIAVAHYEKTLPADDQRREDALGELGLAYRGLHRWADAENVLNRRLAVARRSGDRLREAYALSALGLMLKHAGEFHRAVALFQQALEIDREEGIEETHQDHLDRMHNLANAYDELGEHKRAIRILERVLELEKQTDASSTTIATTMNNLALAYRDDGRLEEARTMYETALRITVTHDGPSSPRLVSTLNGLAGTLKLMGELHEAVSTYERVLAIAPKDSVSRIVALADLGDTEIDLEDAAAGVVHLDEALVMLRKTFPSGHAETVRTLVKRTRGLLALKRLPDANADTLEAIRMADVLAEGDHAHTSRTVSWLADEWKAAGHTKRGTELQRKADILADGKPVSW